MRSAPLRWPSTGLTGSLARSRTSETLLHAAKRRRLSSLPRSKPAPAANASSHPQRRSFFGAHADLRPWLSRGQPALVLDCARPRSCGIRSRWASELPCWSSSTLASRLGGRRAMTTRRSVLMASVSRGHGRCVGDRRARTDIAGPCDRRSAAEDDLADVRSVQLGRAARVVPRARLPLLLVDLRRQPRGVRSVRSARVQEHERILHAQAQAWLADTGGRGAGVLAVSSLD